MGWLSRVQVEQLAEHLAAIFSTAIYVYGSTSSLDGRLAAKRAAEFYVTFGKRLAELENEENA